MGLGGLVLGGALQGIGAGLVQQGQQRAATEAASAQQDAMMRREIALENLRAQNTATRDQSLSALKMDETDYSARTEDWKDARKTDRTTSSTIKVEGVKTQSQIQIDNAKSANDATLAKLQSGLRMTEDQAKAARDLYNDVSKMNVEVGDQKIRADGALVLLSKTGQILSVSKPGLFRDPNDSSAGELGASFPGAALPSAAPRPAGAAPANRPPLSSFEK